MELVVLAILAIILLVGIVGHGLHLLIGLAFFALWVYGIANIVTASRFGLGWKVLLGIASIVVPLIGAGIGLFSLCCRRNVLSN